ncbi:hypothetical protein LEL_00177 [Akanthomyces lecanii RCEF 1005]|uniref:Uncharacterized protein n=1 Tax=Akanthomyces lecanii RCEF 1005 TaxID=1081108 RepID=A0A162KC84_CORDF|nr:hypothetical protein LEL_00177 [Akanthomyces lecanii RCEF 1005]
MTTISMAPVPPPPASSAGGGLPVPVRPKFNSHITSDRLREGAGLRLPPFASNIQKGRTSVFREMGLEDDLAFGSDTYLVVRDDAAKKHSSEDDDATSTTTGSRSSVGGGQQTSRPWYAKLAARPAMTKRQSSQGRMAIPSVNVVGPDSQ